MDEAAAHFAEHGLFWMKDVLSPKEIKALRSAAEEHFNEVIRAVLLKQALSAMSDEEPAPCKHAEVMERDGCRYDVRNGINRSPLATLLRPGGPAAKLIPVLQHVLSPQAHVVNMGNIVAMSTESWLECLGERLGEVDVDDDAFGVQRWHADGPADKFAGSAGDALTLFLPLVDLTASNGATQYHLGSHRAGTRAADPQLAAAERARHATTLHVPAGGAVAFDLRLWHRGLRNAGATDRPMLYAVVGRPLRAADGRCMLPMLDTGATSLFSGAPTPPLLESFALGTPPPNAESDGSEAPRGARGARRARARGDHAATTRPSKSRRRS